MRFVDIFKVLGSNRKQTSTSDHLQESELEDSTRLAAIVRGLMTRVSELEGSLMTDPRVQPTEFEVNVGTAGATTTIQHNFASPVRYTVVHWTRTLDTMGAPGAMPTTGPELVVDPSSDTNNLILKSYVEGKAVIRVEPSAFSVY